MATIVPITTELATGYRSALDSVARERRYLSSLEAPPIERTLNFVASNIANGNPHFVALKDGDVVGWCDIVRDNHPWRRYTGTLGMGVIASSRGRGIGRALITAALAAAKAAQFHRVQLDVYSSNVGAIALYESVGFVLEGRQRDAILNDDGYCDLLTMGLL
jgi:ribosomal protein S18 acetylase RimI-like enzyme